MRIGLPQELLYLECISEFKHLLEDMVPDIEWRHRPKGRTPRHLLLQEDACHPYKKMVKSSLVLADETDLVLLPRLVRLDGYLMCPNFRALPDMVRLNMGRNNHATASVLAPLVDIRKEKELPKVVTKTARELCERTGMSFAGRSWREYAKQRREKVEKQPNSDLSASIALIGHPYMIQDATMNNGIADILGSYGFHTTRSMDLPFAYLNRLASARDYYAKILYWRSAREILGAFIHHTSEKRPAGIIHLVPFNCGVDALMRIELARIARQRKTVPPFMVLVCDQHTQRDHFITRIEAFLDIIDGAKIK